MSSLENRRTDWSLLLLARINAGSWERTMIIVDNAVAPDPASGTKPRNPLISTALLTPSSMRVRNPERRIVGRPRAPQEEAHAGTEVADLLGGVAKEHHRRRGLPALGHPAPSAARDPRTRQGWRLRRSNPYASHSCCSIDYIPFHRTRFHWTPDNRGS